MPVARLAERRRLVTPNTALCQPAKTLLRLEPLEERRQLAAVTVDTWLDVRDGATASISALIGGPGPDGKISLREAIQAANNTVGADTIEFDSTVFTSANGVATRPIQLVLGQLPVTDEVIIHGLGPSSTAVYATKKDDPVAYGHRIFDIGASGQTLGASLAGLRLSGGEPGGPVGYDGGAVRKLSAGLLTVENCDIANNLLFDDGKGGGIYSNGDLRVLGSRVTGNRAWDGGGIWATGSTEIIDSVILDNVGWSAGGGIWVRGSLSLDGSTVAANDVGDSSAGLPGAGAGIYVAATNADSSVAITNSTIEGNYAATYGGGIYSEARLDLTGSTLTRNVADTNGGGVYLPPTGPTITLQSSIVAGNTKTSNEDLFFAGPSNVVAEHSLVGTFWGTTLSPAPVGAPDVMGNMIGNFSLEKWIDPRVGPLTDNGGPTLTVSLLPDSPALNAGSNPVGMQFDQRGAGFVREFGGQADIGAYEEQPRTFVVDTLTDESDGNYYAGNLSLREASGRANKLAGPDTITFASGLSGVITLTGGELILGDGGPLTIEGPGAAQLTVSGHKASRVFQVGGLNDYWLGTSFVIGGLTIADGNANGTAQGGAILSSASLTINDCVISGSSSSSIGGGIYHHGGWFFDQQLYPPLTISGSTLRDNSAPYGGGLFARYGTVNVSGSTFSGNQSTSSGGGLEVASSTLTVANSTLSGNTSGVYGGGIMTYLSTAKVTATTISGNESGGGGGIFNFGTALTLESSVLAGNTGGASGGPDLLHTNGGSVTAAHSLIGTNAGTPLAAAPLEAPDALGNLIGTPAVPIDPKLGPLANNGGPTQTMALLAGSPALNLGSNPLSLAFDQRGAGFPRVAGGAADMGAFELSPTPTPPTVDIVDIAPDPRNTAVASASINFSEAISGFNLADLTLTRNGGANLLTGAQTLTSGDNKSWTLGNLSGLTGSVGSYVLTLTAAGSGIQDLEGTLLATGASDNWTFVDATPPTVDIVDIVPDPRNTAVASVAINFSEAVTVTGFNLADLSLTRNGGANLLTGAQTLTSGDNKTWTLGNLSGLTGSVGSYVLTLTAAGSEIQDFDGNLLATGASDSWTFVDATPPTVEIVDIAPDPRNTAVASVAINFSEAISGLNLSDLALTRNGGANLLTGAQTLTSGDNKSWTLGNLSGLTGSVGGYVLTLAAADSGIQDLEGTLLAAGAGDSWSVDLTAPSVQFGAIASPRNTALASATISFSEAVTGFDGSDLILDRDGDGLGNLLTAAQTLTSGDNKTWTLNNLAPLTGDNGQFTLSFKAAGTGIQDPAGNALANAPNVLWVKETVAPTVDIVDVTPDPRTSGVSTVTIVFSEKVSGFDLADLNLDKAGDGLGSLLTAAQTLTSGDGGKTWTLANLGSLNSGVGAYTLSFKNAGTAIQDLAGNALATGAFDTWTVNAPSLLAGDANRDGKVDLTDFGLLKQHFGVGTLWEQGDFDGNAKVDLGDFGLLKQNFGKTGQAANAAASDEFYARLGLAMNWASEAEANST